MNRILNLLSTVLVILICAAWSQREQSCHNCMEATDTLKKVMSTQKAFQEREADMEKNNVVFGPTEERQAFELAQGEAYRFVCDEGKKSLNPLEKRALMEFVFAMNDLNIESDALHDLNGCFRRKVQLNKKAYGHVATQIGKAAQLSDFVAENQPHYQDER